MTGGDFNLGTTVSYLPLYWNGVWTNQVFQNTFVNFIDSRTVLDLTYKRNGVGIVQTLSTPLQVGNKDFLITFKITSASLAGGG